MNVNSCYYYYFFLIEQKGLFTTRTYRPITYCDNQNINKIFVIIPQGIYQFIIVCFIIDY